jgi:hypothetical protein
VTVRLIDRRLVGLVLVLAVPLEIAALTAFSKIPFDFEPATKPTLFENWMGIAAVILHYPAAPLLVTRLTAYPKLMWTVLFAVGYTDLLLLFGFLVMVFRLARRGVSAVVSTPL